MISNYASLQTGNTFKDYTLNSDLYALRTRVTITGRSTGIITFLVKVRGSDRFTAPTNNTLDLALKDTWWIYGCPIDEVRVDDTGGAGDFSVSIEQTEER
jgi:hypothetical protein